MKLLLLVNPLAADGECMVDGSGRRVMQPSLCFRMSDYVLLGSMISMLLRNEDISVVACSVPQGNRPCDDFVAFVALSSGHWLGHEISSSFVDAALKSTERPFVNPGRCFGVQAEIPSQSREHEIYALTNAVKVGSRCLLFCVDDRDNAHGGTAHYQHSLNFIRGQLSEWHPSDHVDRISHTVHRFIEQHPTPEACRPYDVTDRLVDILRGDLKLVTCSHLTPVIRPIAEKVGRGYSSPSADPAHQASPGFSGHIRKKAQLHACFASSVLSSNGTGSAGLGVP